MKRAVFWCSVLVLAGISMWLKPDFLQPQQVIEAVRDPQSGNDSSRPGLHPRGVDGSPHRRLAHQRWQPLQPAILPLDQINRENISDLQSGLAGSPGIGPRAEILGRGTTPGLQGGDLHHHGG